MNNTNYRRFETNGNPAAMALEDYHDKLDKLHERSQRREKPSKAQRKKAYMHSDMVIREITASMMPKTNDINYFLGVV